MSGISLIEFPPSMPSGSLNAERSRHAMWSLIKDLFPLSRTLISDGFDQSLRRVRDQLPIKVLEYPSGTSAWDWTIPKAWNVREAYIADTRGRRIVDYKNCNLHLSAYSIPFHGRISRNDLLKHLKYLPDLPAAIPYNFLYYAPDWEFNIAYNQLDELRDDAYDVHIDTESKPGTLKIAECYLPGRSREEIFFCTYMCHPSMVNDNLSGVAVCTELFKHLRALRNRKYSYRLLIIPETIGSIAYLAHHEKQMKRIAGGINVYICGDPGPLTYKTSYAGNSLIDRAAKLALKQSGKLHSVRPFIPLGSDERQFNAPGVRLPIGALTRTPPGEFKEYHTSQDDLSFVTPEALYDTLEALYQIVQTLEMNDTYVNCFKGEPCLSKHRIKFESYHLIKNDRSRNYFRLFTNEIDGRNSLLDIAEKWDIPMPALAALADQYLKNGLIKRKGRSSR